MGRIYVVVPRTVDVPGPPYKVCMTCGRMAAHVGHVSGLLARASGVDVAQEFLIVLSVASSSVLDKLRTALELEGVSFVEYPDEDPPFNGRVSAIATWPLEKDRSIVLGELRPWTCKCNEVVNHARVAQTVSTEHQVHNLEAAGAIPAPSSK